jgi:hypothetical protein
MFKGCIGLPAMILLQEGMDYSNLVQHFPSGTAGTANFGLWNRLLGPQDCFAGRAYEEKMVRYNVKQKRMSHWLVYSVGFCATVVFFND